MSSSPSTIMRRCGRRGDLRPRSSCRGSKGCCGRDTPCMSSMKRAALASGSAGHWKRSAPHCYVIAPRKLDEQRTGVKTDARDAATLVSKTEPLCGWQHARASRDPRADRRGGTTAPHPPATRGAGAGAHQNAGAGPQPSGQPQPAGAAALVADTDLEPTHAKSCPPG